MARVNITLHAVAVIIFVITLPFIKSAPRNNKISNNEELATRLVFVDERSDFITSESNFIATSTPPSTTQKSILLRSLPSRPVFVQNGSPLDNNYPYRPTGLPRMDDERQNWGFIVDDQELPEEESYYNRPLAIPKTATNDKSKKVYSKVTKTTEAPIKTKPGSCDLAVVTCCTNLSKAKNCFESQRCFSATDDMFPYLCSEGNIARAIQNIATYYKTP